MVNIPFAALRAPKRNEEGCVLADRELAPRLPVRHCYLALAILLATFMLAFTSSGGSRAQLEWRTESYCALVLPPAQVVRRAQLEAVYCKGLDAENQCQADFGWIVVSEPVPYD